jgi:hypothetical protein
MTIIHPLEIISENCSYDYTQLDTVQLLNMLRYNQLLLGLKLHSAFIPHSTA